jgi:hypothetical protein
VGRDRGQGAVSLARERLAREVVPLILAPNFGELRKMEVQLLRKPLLGTVLNNRVARHGLSSSGLGMGAARRHPYALGSGLRSRAANHSDEPEGARWT